MSDKSKEGKTEGSEGYSTAGLADFMRMQKPQPKPTPRYTPRQRTIAKHQPTEFDGGRKSKKSRKFKKSRKSKKSKSKKYFIYM